MRFNDATVEGQLVTADQQEAATRAFLTRIREKGPMRTSALQRQLEAEGVPHDPAYRAADRLIQKLRKAGVVANTDRVLWKVGPTPLPAPTQQEPP